MEPIKVMLVGGPASLRDDERIGHVADLGERCKVPHGNGYEHFTATGERHAHNGVELPVFAWCYRTRIAE